MVMFYKNFSPAFTHILLLKTLSMVLCFKIGSRKSIWSDHIDSRTFKLPKSQQEFHSRKTSLQWIFIGNKTVYVICSQPFICRNWTLFRYEYESLWCVWTLYVYMWWNWCKTVCLFGVEFLRTISIWAEQSGIKGRSLCGKICRWWLILTKQSVSRRYWVLLAQWVAGTKWVQEIEVFIPFRSKHWPSAPEIAKLSPRYPLEPKSVSKELTFEGATELAVALCNMRVMLLFEGTEWTLISPVKRYQKLWAVANRKSPQNEGLTPFGERKYFGEKNSASEKRWGRLDTWDVRNQGSRQEVWEATTGDPKWSQTRIWLANGWLAISSPQVIKR